MKIIKTLLLSIFLIIPTICIATDTNLKNDTYSLQWPSSTTVIIEKVEQYEPTKKNENMGGSSSLIIFVLLFVATVAVANYYIHYKYSLEAANDIVGFPIQTLNAIVVFGLIYQIEYSALETQKFQETSLARNLSLFTQQVVVDRWEGDAMDNQRLNDIYESVMSSPGGSNNGIFYTKEEWEKLNIPVEYVPYKGHEVEWHYAAKFIQEMGNIVRMFELEKKYRINNQEDLIKSTEGRFAGWLTGFRMWLQDPIVRNVWEQYKYRHIDPNFSAWVQFYCTDVIDSDPEFWRKHRDKWQNSIEKALNDSNGQ